MTNQSEAAATPHPGLKRSGFKRPRSIAVSIASPDTIRGWSHGEVTSGETIDYKRLKPITNGLYCENIFGRVDRNRIFVWENNWEAAEWECDCRAFRGIEHRGTTCDKCKTEVTIPKLRRERMGHIELATPVSHIWFLRATPSPISQMLEQSVADLESVINCEKYLVVDPGLTALAANQVLNEKEFSEQCEICGTGASLPGWVLK